MAHSLSCKQLLVGLIASTVVACGGKDSGGSAGDARRGNSTVGGGVVSTVDGHPITLDDVRELVAAGLPAQEALKRLQAERLLMTDAERRGFGRWPSVAWVGEQARVQALLKVEADAVSISDGELHDAYEKQIARYVKPERRGSVHVLARLPKNPTPDAEAAAKDYAERMLGELALAVDLNDFVARHTGQKTPYFQVTAETIPPADHDGKLTPLVRPYLDALFSTPRPGAVAAPVRTEFGWHAIRVTDILPGESTPFDKAADELRAEMLLVRRKERVQKLVQQLAKTYPVQIAPDVGQTLAKLSL